MPIALAGISIYEGIAAYSAATTVLATVAAGAMIAGGAMTVIGAATGNKDLQNTGMIISAAGGLGTVAANAAGAAEGANAGAASGAADSAGGATYAGQGNADTVFGEAGTPAVLNVSPASTASTASAVDATSVSAKIDALKKSQEAMQKYSLISGSLQGAGTAYSGWAQQQAQKEATQKQIDFERESAARANSVGKVENLKPAGLLAVGGGLPAPSATTTAVKPPTILQVGK
jgi:hypothetical protein